MTTQEANLTRAVKEKKQQEEVNRKLTEDLQAEEDKVNHMAKIKVKLEQSLDELEGEMTREKHSRQVCQARILLSYGLHLKTTNCRSWRRVSAKWRAI
jgi:hypothetical protein